MKPDRKRTQQRERQSPVPSDRLIDEAYRLLAQRRTGKHADKRLSLARPRHSEIVQMLRRIAYDEALTGESLPIVFRDGSSPPPFPLGRMERTEPELDSMPKLIVGLMSFRHPEMDFLVDLYVTRNRELADQLTMADEERVAFERALEAFSDPILKSGGRVVVLHTGLEPMVVGFYRGVLDVLSARDRAGLAPTLAFIPHLYAPQSGRDAKRQMDQVVSPNPISHARYGPSSPGAILESYRPIRGWW